jgi:hypothetical protein
MKESWYDVIVSAKKKSHTHVVCIVACKLSYRLWSALQPFFSYVICMLGCVNRSHTITKRLRFSFSNSPLHTRSLSDECVCVHARVCTGLYSKEKERRKWQPFRLHMLCEQSGARLISEYLWVIAGGKEKEREKNEEKRTTRQMPGFFLLIYSPFFSVVVPFLLPLCQYNTTPSRSSHLVS